MYSGGTLKLPGRTDRERSKKRFMGMVREEMQLVGVKKEDGQGKMEEDNLLW